MSNEVKRYLVPSSILERSNASFGEQVVLASDYDALEARLSDCHDLVREANNARTAAEDERDALRTQLEAIRAAGGEEVEVVAIVDEADDGKFAEVVDVPGVGCTVKMGDKLMTVAQHQHIVTSMAAELEKAKQEVTRWHTLACNHSRAEDRLRAELEAARKQEPVAEVACMGFGAKYARPLPGAELPKVGTKLYALPPLAGQVAVLERAAVALEGRMCNSCQGDACCMPDVRESARELRALLAGQQAEVKP